MRVTFIIEMRVKDGEGETEREEEMIGPCVEVGRHLCRDSKGHSGRQQKNQ